jgi:scyllo-inositol 2-dehydrogenase (NADP+)
MSAAPLRTGLIGRGTAGKVFHAPLIRGVDGMELTTIAGSADAASLIADRDIDLVIVASPNVSHFPLAKAALEAGKHVVVDKPFTVTVEEADELIALATARERLLSVFHNRRWDGDFLTVRSLLPRIGAVTLCEMHWDRFRPAIKPGWREEPADGAGLFFDLAPHMIDQALLLFGLPDAVSADFAIQREEALVDDWFDLILSYGGARVRIAASMLVAAPRPRFALYGRAGSFIKTGLDPQEAALKAGQSPLASGFGEEPVALHGSFAGTGGQGVRVPTLRGRYLSFYEQVAAAIRDGGPAPVGPAEARAGLFLMTLARRSAREGRRLEVPESSRRFPERGDGA